MTQKMLDAPVSSEKSKMRRVFFSEKYKRKLATRSVSMLLCPRRERAASTTYSTNTMYNPAANIQSIRTANIELSKLQTMISDALYSCDCYEMRNLEKEIVTLTKYLVEKAHDMMKDTCQTLHDIEESYGDKALIEQADTIGAYALALISDAM